jgi:hypothetical protein
VASCRILPASLCLLVAAGCAGQEPRLVPPAPRELPRIAFTVQVGAFAEADNALRLVESLRRHGLEAFDFVAQDGLHRVRFGSFPSREAALERARELATSERIGDFFVVPPDTRFARGDQALRGEVVRSALSFLGRPYRWGGTSPETGLDCSGLTMAAYRLNGLELPRAAKEQFAAGEVVSPSALRPADLVFFATESRRKPTHVGLYLGDGRFIHSPGQGDVVRIDALGDAYYRRHFLGARSYLGSP